MTIKRRKIDAWEWTCTCERCGYQWTSVGPAAPKNCSRCKAANWNTAARKYEKEPAVKDYEYRRGSIEVVDSGSGKMRCRECASVWWSNAKSGGGYLRGSWTCHNCGANSKGRAAAE